MKDEVSSFFSYLIVLVFGSKRILFFILLVISRLNAARSYLLSHSFIKIARDADKFAMQETRTFGRNTTATPYIRILHRLILLGVKSGFYLLQDYLTFSRKRTKKNKKISVSELRVEQCM